MELELDTYLNRLGGEGIQDSRGHFTVAGSRVAGQLAVSLVSESTDWILKIVQACCSAQVDNLRIKQTRGATQFFFEFPFALEPDQWERDLLTAGIGTSQASVRHLSIALQVVGLGQGRNWVAHTINGSRESLFMGKKGELSREDRHIEPNETLEGTRVRIGVAFPEGEAGKFAGFLRMSETVQNEYLTLTRRATTSSIPLWLDGKRVDILNDSDSNYGLDTSFTLGTSVSNSQQRLTKIRLPRGTSQAKSNETSFDFGPYYLEPETQEFGTSILRWRYHFKTGRNKKFRSLPRPSRMVLVKDGVTIEERVLDLVHPISVTVYLDASTGCRVNLSGLIAEVDDVLYQQAIREIESSIEFTSQLESALQTKPSYKGKREFAATGIAGMSLLMGLPALTGAFIIGGGLIYSAVDRIFRQNVRREARKQLRDFREQLPRLLSR